MPTGKEALCAAKRDGKLSHIDEDYFSKPPAPETIDPSKSRETRIDQTTFEKYLAANMGTNSGVGYTGQFEKDIR